MYSHINNDIQFDENVEINKKGIDDSDSSSYENDNTKLIRNMRKDSKDSNDNNSNMSNSSLTIQSVVMDLLDIVSPSNDNMSDKSKTDSVISNISEKLTPRFNLKNIEKTKNNLLILSNNATEEHKDIEGSLSHNDINDMFSTINMSCDSIINNEKNHLENISEQTESIVVTEIFIEPACDNITTSDEHLPVILDEAMPPKEFVIQEENVDEQSISDAIQITMDENGKSKNKHAYKSRKKKNAL